ncbi:MAG TPA: sulfatase-like hydrolase/transferase [Xanthobacteraceae bacterium]
MSNYRRVTQSSSDHIITAAKIICLALLFTPLWGWWWYNTDAPIQDYWVFPLAIGYLSTNTLEGACYILVCLSAFAGLFVVAFILPAAVRVPLMIVMLIGLGFELFILDINGTFSNQTLLMTLWQERASGPEVVGGYATEIARNCAAMAILGTVLCAPPARRFSVSGIFGVVPMMAVVMVAGAIVYSKGATQVFPIPFGLFANAAILSAAAPYNLIDPVYDLARNVAINRDFKIGGNVSPLFNKIVVIMDESVRGDYISLNDPTIKTTPFLKTADNLVNFGVAIAGANCSSNARMMFRFGMRQSDLPNKWDEGVRRPTIWQFAHDAGYKTVYIDAFAGPLEYHSGFSQIEKGLIDSKINILDSRTYLRDHQAVDKLVEALKDEGPAFIYLDKFGVHTPYATKYPPDFHVFPTRAGDEFSDRAVMVAHYRNAIIWSVDDFFRKLLPAVDLSRTLIVYTSDHGQSLLQGGYKQTHCSQGHYVHPGEAYVPLFAVTSEPDFKRRLANGAAGGLDRFSHFEVFPTLLLAMGYDARRVAKAYGPSLMDSPAPDRKFLVGYPYLQPRMISAAGFSR